ncbi:MAG: hypothetical protein OXT07_13975 [bacterium]|nr:hypothetical protein [bacterium]
MAKLGPPAPLSQFLLSSQSAPLSQFLLSSQSAPLSQCSTRAPVI